ncbi:glycosyltransferase involved in cell wall biosynthesis [Halospina denitrificans]|uniref:Glycosyltransferase involved in cell wall biosynthesis n=1 Tax=Halospina denitrificans TaxID=332522 RepID=A0A4R7JQE4_9GAMM|nr:glycosyltransferase [Halospina denitrificans]TDT39477.1 glycosyltransferase involved in cell wall biosynthesis [Halospina denitrificans]
MKAIVIVIDQYRDPYAGTEGQVFKLAHGLVDRGWKVRLAVFRESQYIRSGDFPVPVDVLGIGSIGSLGSLLKLYRYSFQLRRENFQLAHIFFNDASVIGPPIFWAAGIPSLISRRDMGFWYNRLHRLLLPWTGAFADSVVCNSKAVAEVTRRVERFPDRKTVVIYNGYPQAEAGINRELGGVPEDDVPTVFTVGLVANLRPIKRIRDLLLASASLVSADIRFELHIVGGGDSNELQATAQALGVEKQVVFWGAREDVPERIKEFDVAVLCSESEGFSNSIIEYMRGGKPVVCTDAGGNAEIVEHGVNGYLYPVGDTETLARYLAELARCPEKRREMGQQGLARVKDCYTIDRMLDEHEALYTQIIEGGRDTNA